MKLAITSLHRGLVLLVAGVLLGSCGGGSGGNQDPTEATTPSNQFGDPPINNGSALPADVHWQPPAGSTPANGNFVYLLSEPGDTIGKGDSFLYTEAESSLAVRYQGSYLIQVGNTASQWLGRLTANGVTDLFRPGFYGDAGKYGTTDPGISWVLEGRECKTVDGWFVIDAHVAGEDSIEFRFMQRCVGAPGVLRGKVRWNQRDARIGPISSPPANLWQPPETANIPATGSFAYFESTEGDYVGEGNTRLFTKETAALDVVFYDTFSVRFYNIVVQAGTESWSGSLFGIGMPQLRQGYYPGVQRYPYADFMIGGMEWARNRRGCGSVGGWFAVDNVVYVDTLIVSLDLRFEQRCDLSKATLRGKIRYSIFDFIPPPGTGLPAQGSLWQPPQGATPAAGDYLYLQSDAGDSIGGGVTRLYTAANAQIEGAPYTDAFYLRAVGDSTWVGNFKAMSGLKSLKAGFYPDLKRMPFHDPARGGLAWLRDGIECGDLSGWAAIDSVVLADNGSIAALEMRFEQKCAGDVGTLRGKLRWSAPQASDGALTAIPELLWQPKAGLLPTTGNYFYVESEYGDPLAGGDTRLYTTENALISHGGLTNGRDNFEGFFQPDIRLQKVRAGFYGNLRGVARSDIGGPTIFWSGRGVSCATATSWYAVDSVTYEGDALVAIETRFETVCDGFIGAFRGKMRWSAIDTSTAHVPQVIPADLWEPPAGAVPSTGNFVYLESEYGDDAGLGRTRLFTSTNSDLINPAANLNRFDLWMTEREFGELWMLTFMTQRNADSFHVGLYSEATRAAGNNPARGAFDVAAPHANCNSISGWFIVDSVAYVDGTVSAIELRFEQHCEERSAPLRGKIRWAR